MKRKVKAWVMRSALRTFTGRGWVIAWSDAGPKRFDRRVVTLTYDDGKPARRKRRAKR